MEIKVYDPNISLIMPVGCNAKCEFCYWEKSEGLTLERFQFICDSTDKETFDQISITGGEPTLADDLIEYLKIARKRFSKVVLNTNGYKLTSDHFEYVDFVNISRHHVDDKLNAETFNTETVPTTEELKELCSYGSVTLNCVIPDKFNDQAFIDSYIAYAKELGARVAFRKYFNNLDVLEDIDTDDTLIDEHYCGACRHRKHIINEVDVTYKYSVQETCDAIDGIYELVIQSNGDLTIDWEGKKVLTYE